MNPIIFSVVDVNIFFVGFIYKIFIRSTLLIKRNLIKSKVVLKTSKLDDDSQKACLRRAENLEQLSYELILNHERNFSISGKS